MTNKIFIEEEKKSVVIEAVLYDCSSKSVYTISGWMNIHGEK